ncbi:MAG TPA: phosphoribosylformylglycinamidine synthase I, partial [Cyanophyceae cyanobacterium]
LGMMPHPERASDSLLGNTDGIKLFQGLLADGITEPLPAISLTS